VTWRIGAVEFSTLYISSHKETPMATVKILPQEQVPFTVQVSDAQGNAAALQGARWVVSGPLRMVTSVPAYTPPPEGAHPEHPIAPGGERPTHPITLPHPEHPIAPGGPEVTHPIAPGGPEPPLGIWGPTDPRPSRPIAGVPGAPGYQPPVDPGSPVPAPPRPAQPISPAPPYVDPRGGAKLTGPYSATVAATGPYGPGTLTLVGDADLGEGQRLLMATCAILVAPGEATVVELIPGTPEPVA
jgi:hypothetical protein